MPRSSSFTPSRPRSLPRPHTPSYHPPSAPQTVAIQPQSFGQSLKDSMAWGIGTSLGQRAVSAVFGAPTIAIAPVAPVATPAAPPSFCQDFERLRKELDTCIANSHFEDGCSKQYTLFNECVQQNKTLTQK